MSRSLRFSGSGSSDGDSEFPAIERARLLFEERLRSRGTAMEEALTVQIQGAAVAVAAGNRPAKTSQANSQVSSDGRFRRPHVARKPAVPVQRHAALKPIRNGRQGPQPLSQQRSQREPPLSEQKRDRQMQADIWRALGNAVDRHVGMLFEEDEHDETETETHVEPETDEFVAFHYVRKGMHRFIRKQVEAELKQQRRQRH